LEIKINSLMTHRKSVVLYPKFGKDEWKIHVGRTPFDLSSVDKDDDDVVGVVDLKVFLSILMMKILF
jgi:hypothetical protein